MNRKLFNFLLIALMAVALTLGQFTSATGAEPAERFLQALRERGYHDMALEYLERMKTSPMAPVELKEIILYEVGTTLIDASREQGDMKLREKYLADARDALQKFVGMHAEHPLASSATSQLGNLLVERARIKIEQSKKNGADKATLTSEARTLYDDAYKVFSRTQNELKEKLAKMTVVDPKDKKKIELRDRLRADYLQAQLLAAAIKEERAETAEAGSQDYKDDLNVAAEEYGKIYEKYRTRLAGLYARMYQGRCAKKLGNYKDALSYLTELLEQPDEHEAFRAMKAKTLLEAIECWAKSKPPLYAEAVNRTAPWLAKARPSEVKTPDFLKLKLELGKVQWDYAKELKEKNPKDPQVKILENEAKKGVQFVSRIPGDLQKEAQQLLATWGGASVDPNEKPDPKTFAEAKTAGREMLDAMQTANLVLAKVPPRLKTETDEAVKKELQAQIDAAVETTKTAQQDAIDYFRLALKLGDPVNDYQELTVVRYFLCYLYYTRADYYDAALVGEFVARRFPDSSGARPCAKIAMAAYLKLYGENKSPDKSFETDHVIEIANYITQKWPDQPEAVEALNTLIPFMIQAGDLDKAEQYLTGIPESSPKRADAEIKTGQAMWSNYLRGMLEIRKWEDGVEPKPEDVDVAAKKTQLEDLKGRAQKILSEGIARLQAGGAITDASVTAALSLAQIYVDTDQIDKAVEILEDPKVGPLTLVKSGSPATQRAGLAPEIYKTSLRAYISSLGRASDPDSVIKKATEVMDAMKQSIEQKQLINIYISLARDLQTQMELANPTQKKALSKGFETFLTRLRSGATEFSVLNWVADTFAGIAKGFDTGGAQLTPDAKKYYAEADATYEAILKKVKFDDPKLETQVLLRQAQVKRSLNDFVKAKEAYLKILRPNPMMLTVQIDAAKLYQDWAAFPGKEELYLVAMSGTEKDAKKKNIIWGWGRMSLVTAKYPKFRNVFHEARYNLALCRYRYAKSRKSPDEKTKYLEKAKSDVLRTQQLYGKGDEWATWRPKYDDLLKQIQGDLREEKKGLPPDKSTDQVATAPAAS